MATSLFFEKDPQFGINYTIKPRSEIQWNDYYTLCRRISLTRNLCWDEKNLQLILLSADIWSSFPALGLTIVDAEFKGGDENQRIDLLYLRDDGGLLPCEIKIGGKVEDAHGQLIRYMADLGFQKLDMEYLQHRRKHFIARFTDPVRHLLHTQKFEKFIEEHQITDKFIRLLPQAGILIVEAFPAQIMKAVRFLNHSCGFAIRMLRVEAFVADDWTATAEKYFMRLDFVDVQ